MYVYFVRKRRFVYRSDGANPLLSGAAAVTALQRYDDLPPPLQRVGSAILRMDTDPEEPLENTGSVIASFIAACKARPTRRVACDYQQVPKYLIAENN